MIKKLPESDLENVIIERMEVGQRKKLGDYPNRTACHEAVNADQMLDYLSTAGAERVKIGD